MLRRSNRLLTNGYYQEDGFTPVISYKETPFRVFRKRRRPSGRRAASSQSSGSGCILMKTAACLCLIFGLGFWFWTPSVTMPSMTLTTEEQQWVDTPPPVPLPPCPAAVHNMADYALESNGGSVMQKHSSKTYRAPSPYQSYLFFNIFWTDLRSPPSHRTVIQGNADLRPGYCWAFAGGRGHLVVSLSHPVSVTHVTLDHILKTVSPTGQISEAPKNFAVFGTSSVDEAEGTWLGSFEYDQDGGAIQTFQLPESAKRVFKFVKLVVQSNWGHEDYTCLYRFRVHGTLSQ